MNRLGTYALFLAPLAAACAAVKPAGPSNEQRIVEITTDATPIADPVVFAAEAPVVTGTFVADTTLFPGKRRGVHGHGLTARRHHSGFAWHPASVTSRLGVGARTSFRGGFGPAGQRWHRSTRAGHGRSVGTRP